MKVIGFVGSPRKEGNTAWAVNVGAALILEAAKAHGADTQCFPASGLDIRPCKGCLACHKEGRSGCVQKDDMQKIYTALEEADALVLGSPVYMGQMTAQTTAFVNRLFAIISPHFSPNYKPRAKKIKLVLVFTQGNPDAGMFKEYFDYTKKIFTMLEFDVQPVVVVTGMREKDAKERADLPAEMEKGGAGLIE
jgi:multimeric flavodoxin WrbA